MIFLGCDGGSTKTELLLTDGGGHVKAHRIFPGCNYAFLGDDGFAAHMKACVETVLGDAGITASEVTFSMFGLPVYGEVPGTEERIPAILRALLPAGGLRVANDAVVSWGGSLAAQPGVSVVAGTGSIAYGCDPQGNDCRVGGWSLHFSDEGSCSWVGRQVVSAFVQQADGRRPRTPIYELVRRQFGLTKDQYFSQVLQIDFRKDASRLADLQRLALEAVQLGDQAMAAVYEAAAGELARMALTVRRRLDFPAEMPTPVSYSGGLFRAGALVQEPFQEQLEAAGCMLVRPRYSPILGAAALAARDFVQPEALEALLERLAQQEADGWQQLQ